MICAEGLQSPAHMMIDTAAGQNLMKQNAVSPKFPIDKKIVLKLTGMSNLPLFTMGEVRINIPGYPTILNAISNEVSIDEEVVFSRK